MTAAIHPSRARVLLAFAAVYLIWGSTYLAIRYAIETLPPFLMAGTRFLVAGSFLYAWVRFRGVGPPTRSNWWAAGILGASLLLLGNGGVTWAEQRIPSGSAALLVAGTPLWMVLLDWARPGGSRPAAAVFAGLGLGCAGLALLIGPVNVAGSSGVDPLGAGAVLIASFAWAAGSIYSRSARLPSSALLTTAMEMLTGGALLLLLGLAAGEGTRLDWSAVSLHSALALGYLTVFGSLIAFSAYVWLLSASTPARVSTYAYVNPAVAVLLGWLVAGESIGPRTLTAMITIVAGVALITTARSRASPVGPVAPADTDAPSPPLVESGRADYGDARRGEPAPSSHSSNGPV